MTISVTIKARTVKAVSYTHLRLAFGIDVKARKALEAELFGKRVLRCV